MLIGTLSTKRVCACPPRRLSFSRTTTDFPRLRRRIAVYVPADPPPSTQTSRTMRVEEDAQAFRPVTFAAAAAAAALAATLSTSLRRTLIRGLLGWCRRPHPVDEHELSKVAPPPAGDAASSPFRHHFGKRAPPLGPHAPYHPVVRPRLFRGAVRGQMRLSLRTALPSGNQGPG